MTRNPTIIHLANVLAIAEADGTFSEPENGALQDILFRIGADDADLDAARDLLEREQPYRLQAFPDPVDNMQMIENMVLVALADGHVSPSASRPLDAFLSSLGFVQADMDMIVQRVRSRLRTIQPPPARPVPPAPRPPEKVRLAVRPGRSEGATPPPADRHPAATASPKPPPLPPQQAKAKSPPAQAQPAPQAAVAVPVPAPAPRAAETPAPADTPVVGCALRRDASPDGACYCFGRPEGPLNPWGCRLLDMAWSADAPWFRLGHFRDDETFVFDRKAIADTLRQRLRAVADCPFLLPGFAEEALSALPSRATTAGRWRHHLASQTTRTESAVPVTVRTYRHGCAQHAVALSDGLSPTDDRDARRMVRRTVLRLRAPVDLARLDGRQGGEP